MRKDLKSKARETTPETSKESARNRRGRRRKRAKAKTKGRCGRRMLGKSNDVETQEHEMKLKISETNRNATKAIKLARPKASRKLPEKSKASARSRRGRRRTHLEISQTFRKMQSMPTVRGIRKDEDCRKRASYLKGTYHIHLKCETFP
jgi:hypothetical protein